MIRFVTVFTAIEGGIAVGEHVLTNRRLHLLLAVLLIAAALLMSVDGAAAMPRSRL